MTKRPQNNPPPTYKRVQLSGKKVTYRKETSGGRWFFSLSNLKYLLAKLFWSRRTLAVVGSVFITLVIAFMGLMIYYAAIMPSVAEMKAAKDQAGVEILASDGSVVARYGQISGKYIPFEKLPKNLINAVLATEDRRFFEHIGVDWRGILRAVYVNIIKGKLSQGGSSITQQLAKNVFLSNERTLERKVQELLMSFWLENNFTKEEILAIYLNRVYFGAGNYGVDAAAQFYANKEVEQLDLSDCAMLAGLLKAPSKYNPTADAAAAKGRTAQVLLNMVDAEMLTQAQAEAEIARLNSGQKQFKQINFSSDRYAADYIYEKLPEYIQGEEMQDMVIFTTIDSKVQKSLQNAITNNLTAEMQAAQKVSQAAGLVMRPDGAILAMSGGRDYNVSQFNRATQSKRQSGSAFKMFVYLSAMQHGYLPDTVMEDAPISVGGWRPHNYKGEYKGTVTLEQAFAESLNTVAVRLSQAVGIGEVRKLAKLMGVRSNLNEMPSLALGAADVTLKEMVTAYAHLASGGKVVVPYGIVKVVRKSDNKVLYARSNDDDFSDIEVIPAADVAKMNVLLKAVVNYGTGRAANIGRDVGGKTGTTSDYRDAWFLGYSPQMVAGIWVGNDDNSRMVNVTGGSIPARIWRDTMREAHAGLQVVNLPIYQSAPQIMQQPIEQPSSEQQTTPDELLMQQPLQPAMQQAIPQQPIIQEQAIQAPVMQQPIMAQPIASQPIPQQQVQQVEQNPEPQQINPPPVSNSGQLENDVPPENFELQPEFWDKLMKEPPN
jgi:penicillin-binding protein 1A